MKATPVMPDSEGNWRDAGTTVEAPTVGSLVHPVGGNQPGSYLDVPAENAEHFSGLQVFRLDFEHGDKRFEWVVTRSLDKREGFVRFEVVPGSIRTV